MTKRGRAWTPSVWQTATGDFAGIDLLLEPSSVCVVVARGKIVKVAKVASDPEVPVGFFQAFDFAVKEIGLKAGPVLQWRGRGKQDSKRVRRKRGM